MNAVFTFHTHHSSSWKLISTHATTKLPIWQREQESAASPHFGGPWNALVPEALYRNGKRLTHRTVVTSCGGTQVSNHIWSHLWLFFRTHQWPSTSSNVFEHLRRSKWQDFVRETLPATDMLYRPRAWPSIHQQRRYGFSCSPASR